jgi:hypothetical protein
MKRNETNFPAWREAAVVNTTDLEKLGRIQLRVFPELSEIPSDDLPWCFPMNGGVHGKSFGVPLVGQLVYAVVFSKLFNEIVFLPFNITKPEEHIFDKWMENQRPEVKDMETDPEEEHLVVDQYEDDFMVFHDTKNNQHGYLHPTGTYLVINKDGSVWVQSVKKYIFHNKDSDLLLEADSDTGDVTFKTKGKVDETVDKDRTITIKGELTKTVDKDATETYKAKQTIEVAEDVSQTYKGKQTTEVTGDVALTGKGNWKVTISGNTEIKTTGNTKIESTGKLDIKASAPVVVESSATATVKSSSIVTVDAQILDFKGIKSQGTVPPSGSGVLNGIPVCPFTGLPHVG